MTSAARGFEPIYEYVDPQPIGVEAVEEYGDLFTYNEVDRYIHAETEDRRQFVVDAAAAELVRKRTEVDMIDQEIEALHSSIRAKHQERRMLNGAPRTTESRSDVDEPELPPLILKQLEGDALSERLALGERKRSFKGFEDDIKQKAASEPPFTLVGLRVDEDTVSFKQWVENHKGPMMAKYGDDMRTVTRAARCLDRGYGSLSRLLRAENADGMGEVIQGSDHVAITVQDPREFFDLTYSISGFGPASAIATLCIADTQRELVLTGSIDK